jgi:hypothetical protein
MKKIKPFAYFAPSRFKNTPTARCAQDAKHAKKNMQPQGIELFSLSSGKGEKNILSIL